MNSKEFNKLERMSVILEQKLDTTANKASLITSMVSDYLINCFCDGKAINGDKLIAFANKIQKLTAENIKLQKQLDDLENKFEN